MSKPKVVSTGGSAVLRETSMKHLSENGICVYIKLPVSEIERRINNRSTRGIAAEKNETLQDIFNFRTPFYEKYADVTVECENAGVEENVQKIKRVVFYLQNKK